jgi:hypothetical protein
VSRKLAHRAEDSRPAPDRPAKAPTPLVIEAVADQGDDSWCSACSGPAPTGVRMSSAERPGSNFVLYCHSCSDRIGGQAARLSSAIRGATTEPVCVLCKTPASLHDDKACSFGFTPEAP